VPSQFPRALFVMGICQNVDNTREVRLRGLLHPAALSFVLLTEGLPAKHAAIPVRGTARPGERRGTSVASPTAARKRATFAGSSTVASNLIRPWHLGQSRTSTAKVRARSSAQGR
jgi:hypothetical protein